MIARSPDGFWRSSLLAGQAWIEHEFGTALVRPSGGCITLKQVHSVRPVEVSQWREDMEADALICREPGVRAGVKTADCVPILLADPARRVVAAIHAGWRGTAGDIAGATVRHLSAHCGSDPANLLAALGPSIGPCCFEVGAEVAALFQDVFPERNDLDRKTFLDLRLANARLLARAGVPAAAIDADGVPCTCCWGVEFHSWRRDRRAGERMLASIRFRQPAAH